MQFNNIYHNQQTRNGFAQWAEQSQYEYFVTLTFRGDITSEKTADDAIETFYKDLCFALFGKPTRRRIPFMAVRERHASGGWHWHVLLSPPSDGKWRPEKLKEAVRSSWVKRGGPNSDPKNHNPDDMQWFQHLISPEHKEKAYGYVCKRINDAETVNLVTLHPAEHLQLAPPGKTVAAKPKPMRQKPKRHYPAKAKPGSPTSTEARGVAHNYSRKGFASSGN